MDLTSNWTQKVDFHDGVRSLTIYEAQWAYAAAATSISIISVFALASLFWGWWELGRDVSLNPLEVALAFNSSLFEMVNSNSRLSQIVRVVGPQKVIYAGEVSKEDVDRYVQKGEEEEEFDLRLLRPRLKFKNDDREEGDSKEPSEQEENNELRSDEASTMMMMTVIPKPGNRVQNDDREEREPGEPREQEENNELRTDEASMMTVIPKPGNRFR